ncbi:MAG TPA: hypothetical protein VMF66_07305 [Candidatus Acidoferrum sp.]|nr:hypothetical protein [Candidatus Acidoferrum sp.]
MKLFAAAIAFVLVVHASVAQTRHLREQQTAPATDRLGLSCSQILAMSSTDWVDKVQKQKGASAEQIIRAIDVYGKCYEERTDRLAALVTRRRAGPPKNALVDFAGFEDAVNAFTQTAIADAQTPPGATTIAYAQLYSEQFRYEFYREYEQKNLHPSLTPDEDVEFTKAKNRFGELIGVLPDAKAHQVHAAFGEMVGIHQLSMAMKFAVYRYAIFILAPTNEKPFAPPPF